MNQLPNKYLVLFSNSRLSLRGNPAVLINGVLDSKTERFHTLTHEHQDYLNTHTSGQKYATRDVLLRQTPSRSKQNSSPPAKGAKSSEIER